MGPCYDNTQTYTNLIMSQSFSHEVDGYVVHTEVYTKLMKIMYLTAPSAK